MGNIDCTTQNCCTCEGKGHCLMCINGGLEKENKRLKNTIKEAIKQIERGIYYEYESRLPLIILKILKKEEIN